MLEPVVAHLDGLHVLPLIFGRAGEEIAALREAGIPFEIVPGITSAFAAAAKLQTPLTDRSAASKLILATAHHAAGKLELTPKWDGAFPADATLVIYMPGRSFRALADDLIVSGIAAETPCVAISKATTPDEHVLVSTLARIEDGEVGPAPVILLVGQAIKVKQTAEIACESGFPEQVKQEQVEAEAKELATL